MANRIWFHLIGRGIVDPVDDFRDSNPPANPALLDALTDQFLAAGIGSATRRPDHEVADLPARLPSPNATSADDEANFARASVRLLPAEVLLDAISQALGKPGTFTTRSSGSQRDAVARGKHGRAVPQGLRQARPPADLRV